MSWQTDMTEILRVLINDAGDTPTYSDTTLQRTLVVAAYQVNQMLSFSTDYTISIASKTISPDPTVEPTIDDDFVNLTCLKAACIVDQGAASVAAKQAISVRDGSSAIDLRGVLGGKIELLKHGWCKVFEETKFEYAANKVHSGGAAVLTPFRTYF